MQHTIFDEMVRLLCLEQLDTTGPKYQIFGLRDIVYSTHEELASLLNAMEHPTPLSSSHIVHDGTPLGDEVDEHEDDQELEIGSEMDEAAPEDLDIMPDTEIPEGVYLGHSEQDMRAACVIQHVWKKYLDKKRDMMKAGLESSARRWFEDYRKALLPGMRFENSRSRPQYSVYFLGPLPNLQATLDSIQPVLYKEKDFLKKSLGDNHEDLEEIGLNLTRVK
jgi:hypothetical protein